MIQTILGSLFMFNADLSASECARIEKQINTLKSLYITDFEVILLPKHKDREFRVHLYEDPDIHLLCPLEIEEEIFTEFGVSIGLVNKTQYGYDIKGGCFRLSHTVSELIEMFSGNETLLFMEYIRD